MKSAVLGTAVKAFQLKVCLRTSLFEDLRAWVEFKTGIAKISDFHSLSARLRGTQIGRDQLVSEDFWSLQTHDEG
jgi:hypothetical protein